MRSSRSSPLLASLAVAMALAVTAAAPPAYAQAAHEATAQELETARTLFREGKELRAKGDLNGALEKLQAAHALGNTPVTGLELARTYVMVGKIAEAREVALYSAHIPVAPDETQRSADARVEAAKLAEDLRPRIPTLAVTIAGLAPGEAAHLSIDGVAVPDAAMGEPQKVDPGAHDVAVRAGQGPTAREAHASAQLKEGETGELTVTLPPVAPTPPPPAPSAGATTGAPPGPAPAPAPSPAPAPPEPDLYPHHRRSTMPLAVKLGFGTAMAGGAVGLIAGLTALNKKGQLDGECTPAGGKMLCDEQTGAASDLQTARTWATVSTVAFVVGGVGAVVGLIGLVTGGGSSSSGTARAGVSPWIGAGTAGVHGRF